MVCSRIVKEATRRDVLASILDDVRFHVNDRASVYISFVVPAMDDHSRGSIVYSLSTFLSPPPPPLERRLVKSGSAV